MRLALRRPDFLAGGVDGQGDREDLREGAGDGGKAGGQRVEGEIGVFCG